ncbi:MAG TPA: hypothetical protein VI503_06400 [Gaiellaceae bacterium]|nr:hypothetical protein [Gaiellaceae bacterium]
MACAAGLVLLALDEAGDVALVAGVRVGPVALLALVAGLVLGWSSFVPASLVLLGATYATHLAVDDAALDVRAPLVAAGLVVTAELAYWSLEERENVWGEPGDGLRRLGLVAVVALATTAVGAALIAFTGAVRAGGLGMDVLGAGAAAAVLFLVVLAVRRAPG